MVIRCRGGGTGGGGGHAGKDKAQRKKFGSFILKMMGVIYLRGAGVGKKQVITKEVSSVCSHFSLFDCFHVTFGNAFMITFM